MPSAPQGAVVLLEDLNVAPRPSARHPGHLAKGPPSYPERVEGLKRAVSQGATNVPLPIFSFLLIEKVSLCHSELGVALCAIKRFLLDESWHDFELNWIDEGKEPESPCDLLG